mmetsp:Transcript_3190/g.8831  ORF Transcript_3190/g.8831 Transcript_3190/m.8831 type:complete len:116 (+) Transcript_3190:541-888(+)
MHCVVHDAKDDSRRSLGNVGMPAIRQNGNMMVPVQQNKRLLVDDNEVSINQLREFAQNEELNPGSNHVVRPVHLLGIEAKIFGDGVMVKVVCQLRSDPAKSNQGKHRKTQIPKGQ